MKHTTTPTYILSAVLISFCCLLLGTKAHAQAPDGINYQAVIRNFSGTLVANSTIAIRIQIKQTSASGTIVFQERHSVTTSPLGVVNLVIGQGTLLGGNFSTINWATGPYFVSLGVNFTNGSTYLDYGSQQLMSVPYALYAKNAGNQLNQWRYGTTVPAAALGTLGDFYLNMTDGNVYYKSNPTTWLLTGNITGPAGATGATGAQGIQGVPGPSGAAGTNGAQGIQGLPGIPGAAGATGATGAQGIQGVPGPSGAAGTNGAQGIQGAPGVPGPQGIQGLTGAAGSNGLNGQNALVKTTLETAGANCTNGGVKVESGLDANNNGILDPAEVNALLTTYVCNGLTGAQGIQGLPGTNGAVGATGPAGAQGIQGLPGTNGPAGATGAQSAYQAAVTNGFVGTEAQWLTSLQGAQGIQGVAGPAGPTGAQGIQGVAGATGPIGPTGPAGVQGIAGPTGPIGLTGPAGTNGAAGATGAQGIQGVAGATGPIGPTGPIGLTGAAGATGPAGANGTNGQSAYQAAVTNGFVGTEAQWLTSLQGAQGIQGVAGATGPIGPTGPIGLTGAAGATGAQGIQGVAGPTGPAGAVGATGPAGAQGIQGATGLLTSGSAAGNTPYWNGSQWVVNNSNVFNNGAEVGIGTVSPNTSAKLDVESTTQGFLPPRMTTTQRNAIASPAAGLTIYNTTVNCLQWWNGTIWYDGCGNNTPSAALTTLNCGGATTTGTLTNGTAASGVSTAVSYTGGNAGTYGAQSISSTGVVGLTATLAAGTLANGAGSLTYTITGTPTTSGTATFAITVGGQSCSFTVSVGAAQPQYPAGTVNCAGATTVVDVTNPTTGKIWMDRNLGATQVATSSTDVNAYGDLYQWGRRADGHQCRTSPTTATLSSVDQPAHGNFILAPNAPPADWRNSQNANLWQGVNGVNNPCPSGYRIPTETEINDERLSWSQNNSVGAFASPLKFTLVGFRYNDIGTLGGVGASGNFWSSAVSGTYSRFLGFASSSAGMGDDDRAAGLAVRCLKDASAIPAAVGALNCGGATLTGNLFNGSVASGVSVLVPYTAGNGGSYAAQTISSTGVVGLTATLAAGTLANGAGSLTYTITGTPTTSGTASFAITVGGQSCSFTVSVGAAIGQYPAGTVHCAGATTVVDVTNPTTGRIWMDRNLGATQVATSSTDANSFGDLYQWGRRADGHQCRTSPTTATLSSIDQPGGSFITINSGNYDWRSPQNANLWQGVNGVNNPCPSGYRIPTETEINAERLSWSVNTSVGAFASPLKWTLAGYRVNSSATLDNVGASGVYWSSTVSGLDSRYLDFVSSNAFLANGIRAYGFSVRCLKDASAIPAAVGAINCGSAALTGNLFNGSVASGVSVSVPYTAGNGGSYAAQSVSSTGVVGLTATLAAGTLANGAGSLTYTISGTPTTSGTATFAITVGGQSCSFTVSVGTAIGQYPAGTVHCAGATTVVDVTNPTTGRIWMDRNLGATQVATSSTDVNSYGDLYQWGRRADGHQCRTSPTTATLSSVDQPAHGDFIIGAIAPYDWRSPQNSNLWQGVNGVNNPCPSGYRIPTETEMNAELASWTQNNSVGAFASPLKLPVGGYRRASDNSFLYVGTTGVYWSSTVSGSYSRILHFNSTNPAMLTGGRGDGGSVRCLKD
jgi:uncharacterized protein (TIGR02145 family)